MTPPLRFRLWRFCHSLARPRYYYLSGPHLGLHVNEVVFTPEGVPEFCDTTLRAPRDEETLEQWTGIKDRTGRDVYDGDLLRGLIGTGHSRKARRKEALFSMGWSEWSHGWCLIPVGDYGRDYRFYPATESCTVVGNAHEGVTALRATQPSPTPGGAAGVETPSS